ncbi:preprotein translocase subunit SecE [Microbacterium foliorum]|uniref:Protein translocase subunit SecE n=1 Tax=Microbacterium foliorum TaxID=104336 RepID=A0A0F0KNS5_9MICO|nr:preprotein translocase subunit SecE [Microbacterium foliorum]AXL12940.1 preprotein translocase subunit SecE [Microbacterium foliorum]KJL20896.1 Protein translocase subunit SecE [Microbacterium foliorum]CAH0149291.1 Protein translocase subunit SecE [Microbacterium foliorum]CAH0150824.1 Protein translocase subunit SecE [Microbacterium foliorum]
MDQDEPRGDVVASGATREKKRGLVGFFAGIALFFRQVIAELRKVVTPTRKELVKFTAVVLVFVLIVMGIVYGLDTLFAWVTHVVFGVPGA